jgi:uncharacterized membrane protein YjgN (DUF898 family)
MVQPPIAADTRAVLVYDGKISQLYGIFLLNLLLTIITLGIFRFWAITRIRRYLWSHMRFEGTRFTYTGRGKELFFGFLLAMLVLVLALAGAAIVAVGLAKIHPFLAAIPMALAYIGLLTLFGAAHFSAQRYRLSRTEWRGIRGGMEGSALRYGLKWLLYVLLVIVTLMQAVPWMQVGLACRRISASRFGSAVFQCHAAARRLYPIWLGTFLGSLVLLGLILAVVAGLEAWLFVRFFVDLFQGTLPVDEMRRAARVLIIGIVAYLVVSGLLASWYYASLSRLILGGTTATVPGGDTLRFSSGVTAGGLFWLVASNTVIAIVTLGLGLPIVLHRYAGYVARTTHMSGRFDAAALMQSTLARPSVGEGFLQALDPGIV